MSGGCVGADGRRNGTVPSNPVSGGLQGRRVQSRRLQSHCVEAPRPTVTIRIWKLRIPPQTQCAVWLRAGRICGLNRVRGARFWHRLHRSVTTSPDGCLAGSAVGKGRCHAPR